MSYSGEGVNALVCALEDLKHSSLIYVDRNLRQVLKCLAYYPEFREVLSKCNEGFDYPSEKARALGRIGDSFVFRMPKTRKATVALVSNMLVDFDAGEMDVVIFASTYFPSASKQDSFDSFCFKLIEPFKLAIVDLIWSGVDEEPAPIVEREVEYAKEGVNQSTEYLITALVGGVKASDLPDGDRRELSVMLEGLAYSLDIRDALMIRAVWFGVRRALNAYNIMPKEVAEMDKTLTMYMVIA